jgi:hypothetical protein
MTHASCGVVSAYCRYTGRARLLPLHWTRAAENALEKGAPVSPVGILLGLNPLLLILLLLLLLVRGGERGGGWGRRQGPEKKKKLIADPDLASEEIFAICFAFSTKQY